jgi:hypothetical protein
MQLLEELKAANQVFSRGSSAYRGTSYEKATGKYRAQIRIGGKQEHLGCYSNEEEAARAYDREVIKRDGRFVGTGVVSLNTNLPDRNHDLIRRGIRSKHNA